MKTQYLLRRFVAGLIGMALLAGCSGARKEEPAAPAGGGTKTGPIKIGFLVKQPEEPWFQYEWKFGGRAAKDLGCELLTIGIPDGEKTLAAIDNLSAAGAQGFVICIPDVRMGPAVAAKAKAAGLKFMCVDDAFIGTDGQVMADIPYYGMSARKIGNQVGEALLEEMKRRGWNAGEVAGMAITYDELDTIRERTQGAIEVLTAAGVSAEKIYLAPTQKLEIPAAMDAANTLLTQKADVKKWLVFGGNDNSVLGAIRATEQHGLAAENVIGVGINGTDCQIEFQKEKPTGFYASILPEVWNHGYQTVAMVHKWVTTGEAPPVETRTAGLMINRENFRQILKEKGIME